MRIQWIQYVIDGLRGKTKRRHNELLRQQTKLLQDMLYTLERQRYTGGQRWERELQERYNNPLYLEGYGYKVFSQNDEDGIINEIFHRIKTTNKIFIEFGVQDGIESNSHLLLTTGWKGLWIEGDSRYCLQINEKFRTSLQEQRLTLLNSFITRDNINHLFRLANIQGEIDFLSVDIDGNDWHILKSILEGTQINPRVICVEYNALIPPAYDVDDTSTDWVMEYVEDWKWNGDDCQGASLSALYRLCREHKYDLVGTCANGVNAFFVRNDLVQDKFISCHHGGGVLSLYNPWRHQSTTYLKPFTVSLMNLHEDMQYRLELYKKYYKR